MEHIAIINSLLSKCSIYYGDCLISKEMIINYYSQYFTEELNKTEHTVSFALHTGSICFDIMAIAIVTLYSMSRCKLTNEEIISDLSEGDMVMYCSKRYRWKGIEEYNGEKYIVLEQDPQGKSTKNGLITRKIPESNKHLITPYYGSSLVTDGRGIRNNNKTKRDSFLSYLYDVDINDVPSIFNISIVIVGNKDRVNNIVSNIRYVYDNKSIELLDIIPVSYYSKVGRNHQFGFNPSKSEPVIKVVQDISTARRLYFDKQINKVSGLILLDGNILLKNDSVLQDLMHREKLGFVHVLASENTNIEEYVLKLDDITLFACTKSYLSREPFKIICNNELTSELNDQIHNIISSNVNPINIDSGWAWNEYEIMLNSMNSIRHSHWSDDNKNTFLMYAQSLIKLLSCALFPMKDMENAIECGLINKTVLSPRKCIDLLLEIANTASSTVQELCLSVICTIEDKYNEYYYKSPKLDALLEYLYMNKGKRIAVIIQNRYYKDIIMLNQKIKILSSTVEYITNNSIDYSKHYDSIILSIYMHDIRINIFQCSLAPSVNVMLYEYEYKYYDKYRKLSHNIQGKINSKIGISQYESNYGLVDISELNDSQNTEEIRVNEYDDLSKYIDELRMTYIPKTLSNNKMNFSNSQVSEVAYIGICTTGEMIYFTKYYEAVVFNASLRSIAEKSVDRLQIGDEIIFIQHDNFTKNIVDVIYDELLNSGKLDSSVIDATEKSLYWKKCLNYYKNNNNYTYAELTNRLHNVGSTLSEVTIRQWLIDDSHIVGPKDPNTMKQIASITNDEYLLEHTNDIVEACKIVRHTRRNILKLIGKVVNDNLSGNTSVDDDITQVVYENIDQLAVILELEDISKIDESITIPCNLVNRPLAETEVEI